MANKVLGLIRRTFGSHNPEGDSTAYKTFVGPILEYGCQVWNPYTCEAHQKYRVGTEASYSSYLRMRERISGETWGLKDVHAKIFQSIEFF